MHRYSCICIDIHVYAYTFMYGSYSCDWQCHEHWKLTTKSRGRGWWWYLQGEKCWLDHDQNDGWRENHTERIRTNKLFKSAREKFETQKIPDSKNPKLRKSKTQKIQNVEIGQSKGHYFDRVSPLTVMLAGWPVIAATAPWTLVTMSRTSPVSLPAPMSLSPCDTMTILRHCDSCPATSAATYRRKSKVRLFVPTRGTFLPLA